MSSCSRRSAFELRARLTNSRKKTVLEICVVIIDQTKKSSIDGMVRADLKVPGGGRLSKEWSGKFQKNFTHGVEKARSSTATRFLERVDPT